MLPVYQRHARGGRGEINETKGRGTGGDSPYEESTLQRVRISLSGRVEKSREMGKYRSSPHCMRLGSHILHDAYGVPRFTGWYHQSVVLAHALARLARLPGRDFRRDHELATREFGKLPAKGVDGI